jgi:E3 ubiquitin-protein ligase SHPRH
MEKGLQELGLDVRGVMLADGRIDTVLLRSWLRRLRMLCTHPQVGQLRTTDKSYRPGVLKSMNDVLDVSALLAKHNILLMSLKGHA